MAKVRRRRSTAAASSGAAFRRAVATTCSALDSSESAASSSATEFARPLLGPVELGQEAAGLLGEAQDPGRALAVLPGQLAQHLAAGPHLLQSFGVVVPRLDDPAELRRDIRRISLQRRQSCGELRQWAAPVQRGPGRTQQVDDGAPVSVTAVERGQRGGGRFSVRGGCGQSIFFLGESVVLVRVVERGGVDLPELVTKQVGLPGPRPIVAPERFELGVQGASLPHER